MNTLPSWIIMDEIKRFNELKARIFADGPFVVFDSKDLDQEEYNTLGIKIARLCNGCFKQ